MRLSLAPTPNPHYARIGGSAAVARLVDAFYAQMDARPEAAGIRALHGADLEPAKARLRLYLEEWLGGPREYTRHRGPPRLRHAHAAFAIGPAERDAWMQCMRAALAQEVADEELRRQLDNAFLKLADTVRNDPENPHDHHHHRPDSVRPA